MKLHIENIHITVTSPKQPAGLLATLAIATASAVASRDLPKIGEKWPGTEAVYAGVALDSTEDHLVHLILWLAETTLDYDEAVRAAEAVAPDMNSHLPTRHQSITLFERLPDHFDKNPWYWTLTKTPSGKAAFIQDFYYGGQGLNTLSAECRVRAVSEIPL